jgi:type I pantothenate kinase
MLHSLDHNALDEADSHPRRGNPTHEQQWTALDLSQYPQGPIPEQSELERLSGILDPVDPLEVVNVFNPWVDHLEQHLQEAFAANRPVVIGMTGSVCSGKTTAARVLHYLFAQRYGEQNTTLLTLDNFLKPNAEIARCAGGMISKGFPDTFRFTALLEALSEIAIGRAVEIPCYDHAHYDIFENQSRYIPPNQKVVIVEGIIAAQNTPPGEGTDQPQDRKQIRDHCDTMIFVQTDDDAHVLPRWFEERMMLFAHTARRSRGGHLAKRYAAQIARYDQCLLAGKDPVDAKAEFERHIRDDAKRIWSETNGPNYTRHIAPSKQYCDALVLKSSDHRIAGVYQRNT